MTTGRFLGGIGALLWRPEDNHYFLLQRAAHRDVGAGSWECVTGRLEQGEGFEEALHREVREELSIPIEIAFLIGTAHFYRGEAVPDNELIGVMYCCTTPDLDAIVISAEHAQSRWISADKAYEFLDSDHWLYGLIQRAEFIRQNISLEMMAYNREHGYETGSGEDDGYGLKFRDERMSLLSR